MRFEKLGNIAEVIAGQSPKSETYNQNGDGLPFFQGKTDFGEMFPKARYWCNEPTKIALPNDILISVRAPVGPVNICNVESCIGRGLGAIRVNKNISKDYVYYFLKANEKQIANLGVGSTFKAITQREIRNIVIPLPTFEDQIRISSLLCKAEAIIKQRKESIDLLDEYLKSMFLEIFGDPVRNEKGWNVERLDKVSKLARGRFSPRPRNDPSYFDGIYPFIQTGDISRSGNRLTEFSQTLNEKGIKVSKQFKKGTIVIAIVGATIGATAICGIDVYATDSIIGISANEKFTNNLFLEFTLRLWKPYLLSIAPEAARANINLEILNKLAIVSPPTELQNQFAIIVEKTESLKAQYRSSLTELESLYAVLSQKAFKGELNLEKGEEILMAAEQVVGYGAKN